MDKARETAVRILYEVHENGAYANVALAKALRQLDLGEQDRRFVTELVYGAVKAGGTLDWILRRYVSRPVRKIQPLVREILRLGLYQIFYLDKVPASAACNTAVDLAKGMGVKGLSGFVNAVLRTAVREPEKAAFPSGKGHATENLALRSQHPGWLVRHWVRTFGFEAAEKLCAFDNEQPVLSVRANTLRTDREALLAELAAAGAEAEPSQWAPEGILVRHHGALDALAPLQEGRCQVQDESSMLVAHVVGPQPGEFIIDCCAAPGGKTTHMAALMHDEGRILAGDIYSHKLQRIEENAARLGIQSIETEEIDAREIGEQYEAMADRVLVDAPCSGLGVIRKKPDIRYKDLQEFSALPEIQRAILENSARYVKRGGLLVYSTCTILPEENEQVTDDFLKAHDEFTYEAFSLPNGVSAPGHLTLWPQRDNTDGFYLSRMRRKTHD